MNYIKRRWAVIAAIAILIGGVMIKNAFTDMKEPPKMAEKKSGIIPVEIRMVENEAKAANVIINGRLASKDKYDVYTEVNGRLLSTTKSFKDGTAFKKGEVMLKIDDTDLRLNLVASRSAFQTLITSLLADLKIDYASSFDTWNNYLKTYDATKSLPSLPTVTDEKLKNFLVSKNIFNQYYAIKSQEAQLGKYIILAPFDGIVSEAIVNPNTILRAGQRIGVFVDPVNFELEAGVSYSEISKISVGNKVVLTSSDIAGQWMGTISRKSETVDGATQNVKVYVDVTGKNLFEGVYLNGTIQGQALDSAATIPRYLIVNESQVFTVSNNQLQLEDIQIVHDSEDMMVVRGLADGTKLVNQVVPGAYEGMEVEIIE